MILQIAINDFAHEALPGGGYSLRCRTCGGVIRCLPGDDAPGVMLHAASCRTLAGLLDLRAQVPLVLLNLPGPGLVEIQHDVLAS